MTPPVAVVTGAARGIGAATAERLAADGWRVGLVDVCADDPALGYAMGASADLERTTARCAALAGDDGVLAVEADVRDTQALDSAVGATVDSLGPLRGAVAAAAVVGGGTTTWETPPDVWRAVVDVNLDGVWNLARSAIPRLLAVPEPRSGRFVALASAAGIQGFPFLGAYTAAKHAVVGLVRSLSGELGPSGVTVNAVCPGSTKTAMLAESARLYDLAHADEFVRHQAIGRLLEPEEIAAAIAWLCSPAASGVTGAILPVDGGMTAG